MWSDVQEPEPSAAWVELPENGWGALIGWAAGTENLRRHYSSDEGRTVTVHTERAGVQDTFEEPFTAADRRMIDDDISTYLRDAGLPPRPGGYVWKIRVPDGQTSHEAFLSDVDTTILRAAEGAVDPKQLRPIFEAVLRSFYAEGN